MIFYLENKVQLFFPIASACITFDLLIETLRLKIIHNVSHMNSSMIIPQKSSALAIRFSFKRSRFLKILPLDCTSQLYNTCTHLVYSRFRTLQTSYILSYTFSSACCWDPWVHRRPGREKMNACYNTQMELESSFIYLVAAS